MEAAAHNYTLFKRSARSGAILSLVYALVTNLFYFASYYSAFLIDYSYIIGGLLTVAFAIPIVKLFTLRHWYVPVFMMLLWVPLYLLIAFAADFLLPQSGNGLGDGLALIYFFILNLAVVAIGIGLGLIILFILFLYRKIKGNTM